MYKLWTRKRNSITICVGTKLDSHPCPTNKSRCNQRNWDCEHTLLIIRNCYREKIRMSGIRLLTPCRYLKRSIWTISQFFINLNHLDMFLWNTYAPRDKKVKIFKSYILTPSHLQGQWMSVRCEQPINELKVQVWLLYHNTIFKYYTL